MARGPRECHQAVMKEGVLYFAITCWIKLLTHMESFTFNYAPDKLQNTRRNRWEGISMHSLLSPGISRGVRICAVCLLVKRRLSAELLTFELCGLKRIHSLCDPNGDDVWDKGLNKHSLCCCCEGTHLLRPTAAECRISTLKGYQLQKFDCVWGNIGGFLFFSCYLVMDIFSLFF